MIMIYLEGNMNKSTIFIAVVSLFVSSFVPLPNTSTNSIDVDCVPVPSGLVYWLRAENNTNDFTGVHNGLLHGGTSYLTGAVGTAFSFDGDGDYISIPGSDTIPFGSTSRTLEMWIYSLPGTWVASRYTPFFYGSQSTRQAFGIDFDAHPYLQFYVWADDFLVLTSLPAEGWFHVAMTYDGDKTLNAYINGTLVGSHLLAEKLSTVISDNYVGYGGYYGGNEMYFLGRLDEVSMYDRELSLTEIQSIYNAGSNGKCTYSYTIPTITSLDPLSMLVGASQFTLTVTGTGFVPESVVKWNGSTRTTGFLSDTQLAISVPAIDVATPGVVSITVENPTPGGGISNSYDFNILYGNYFPLIIKP
jgi:hypothetical protein